MTGITPQPLRITITKLRPVSAVVYLGFYLRQNDFLNPEDIYRGYQFVTEDTTLNVEITDLEYGEYALALFQDMNGSGKISRNIMGLPTDPFAFSNNFKPRFRPPSFDDCRFTHSSKSSMLNIVMNHGIM